MEIERKFLVNQIPSLNGYEKSNITQGYISFSPEVRIRKRDNKYYLTKKGEGMIARTEDEAEVSSIEGEKYFSQVISNLIEKTRYIIPLDSGYIAELDIYQGIFKGLVVVEVEFETLKQAQDFTPPEWFGEDISENIEYRNKILATKY